MGTTKTHNQRLAPTWLDEVFRTNPHDPVYGDNQAAKAALAA